MRLTPLVAAGLLLMHPAGAADLHSLWDRQCGGCHDHAGDFARQSLRVVDGRLVGATLGDRVADYLTTHNGGYSPEVIAAMVEMLGSQARTPDLFRSACAECHGLAAQFVRESLIARDGVLVDRRSGRPVAGTLAGHGGLDEAEAAMVLEVLIRIEREVHASGR